LQRSKISLTIAVKEGCSHGKIHVTDSGREEVPGGALLNGGRGLVAGYATRLSSFCIDTFAGRADEDELFQTRSKLWDRSEMLHGVAARGAY
jgi:hypothetical protein